MSQAHAYTHTVRQYILHSGMLLLNEIELGLVSHELQHTKFGALVFLYNTDKRE